MDKEKLFKDPRWTTYQPVQALNIEVQPTEDDKKKVEEFRKFIDETIENEKMKDIKLKKDTKLN